MARAQAALLVVGMLGCGGEPWRQHTAQRFVLDCAHEAAPCESCHPAGQPLGPVDEACAACHLVDRPASHDPATTGTCEGCHASACGWESATSPHPPGWVEAGQHGTAANVQDPSEGACRDCHGEDLSGGSASGCDDCHAEAGHPDWRTDCTFCHGSEADGTGAPPEDVDGESDPAAISFRAHLAHVLPGPEFRPLPCSDCHAEPADVSSPGHTVDDTPGTAEVDFSGSFAPETAWGGLACTTSRCHGDGRAADGAVVDGGVALDCDGCHRTTSGFEALSGYHPLHLAVAGVACADCHAAVVDASGAVVGGAMHVDGDADVALAEPAMSRDPASGTCQGTCHGHAHDVAWGGGHPPGFEAAAAHGPEALLQRQACATAGCHGTDLQGGDAGLGCDGCHAPGWRRDCTYCHGGVADATGAPPRDLDGTLDEDTISLRSHPEHVDADDHAPAGCGECHGAASLAYADALLDPGHWWDASPGAAEVAFDGRSPEATWDPSTASCGTVACHGDGRTPGAVTDGSVGLACDGCHPDEASPPDAWGGMSGEHRRHLEDAGARCSDCHAAVVRDGEVVRDPSLHVDGDVDVRTDATTGIGWNGQTCVGQCHGDGFAHDAEGW